MRLAFITCPSRHCYRSFYARHISTDMTVNKFAHPFDKTRFDALLNRRFFYAPAFEIYGGVCNLLLFLGFHVTVL